MSTPRINVETKLAAIKAMGGNPNKIDSAEEQFQLSVFYNEVNYLNPKKYSAEDRKKVNECLYYTRFELGAKYTVKALKLCQSNDGIENNDDKSTKYHKGILDDIDGLIK